MYFSVQLLQIDLTGILCEKSNNIIDVDEISLGVGVLLFILVQVPTNMYLLLPSPSQNFQSSPKSILL